MAIETKQYLDYLGLKDYDGRLKNWVQSLNTSTSAELQEAISNLEELVGSESVEERVSEAVAKIVDSAPETFDTLKEVADWIETHGEAAAALLQEVHDLEDEVAKVDQKVDDVYNAIQSISGAQIAALFLEAVAYDNSKSVAEQIAALGESQKLVINAATDATITEDITINSDCTIEAEGVEFTGNITIAEGKEITVIGATFSGAVTIQ